MNQGLRFKTIPLEPTPEITGEMFEVRVSEESAAHLRDIETAVLGLAFVPV